MFGIISFDRSKDKMSTDVASTEYNKERLGTSRFNHVQGSYTPSPPSMHCLMLLYTDNEVYACINYRRLTPAAYKRVPSCSVVAKVNLMLMAAMASDGLGRALKESSMKLS